jgi:hypothetical protein
LEWWAAALPLHALHAVASLDGDGAQVDVVVRREEPTQRLTHIRFNLLQAIETKHYTYIHTKQIEASQVNTLT